MEREEEANRVQQKDEGVLLIPSVMKRRKRTYTKDKDGLIFASMIADDEDGNEGAEGLEKSADFDRRFYYRRLEGAAAEEEDDLALISLERSYSATIVENKDIYEKDDNTECANAYTYGHKISPLDGKELLHLDKQRFVVGSPSDLALHSPSGEEDSSGPKDPVTAFKSLSIDTTEPAESPESIGLQLSPDVINTHARTQSTETGRGTDPFIESSNNHFLALQNSI